MARIVGAEFAPEAAMRNPMTISRLLATSLLALSVLHATDGFAKDKRVLKTEPLHVRGRSVMNVRNTRPEANRHARDLALWDANRLLRAKAEAIRMNTPGAGDFELDVHSVLSGMTWEAAGQPDQESQETNPPLPFATSSITATLRIFAKDFSAP